MEKIDVAILAATPTEKDALSGYFRLLGKSIHIAGNLFTIHHYRSFNLLIGTTGLGKVNAAATAAVTLSTFEVREVWNIGCAGSYSGSGLEIGDVLISRKCICGDEGILSKSGSLPSSCLGIPLVIKDDRPYYDCFPLDDFLIRRQVALLIPQGRYQIDSSGNIHSVESRSVPSRDRFQVLYGPSLTVGMASGDIETAAERFTRHKALAENMEGSAIAQICLRFDVPFLELRGISNIAGMRDKERWELGTAIEHCHAVVKHLLANMVI